MAGKSIQYWQKQWGQAKGDAVWKSLTLLAQYAGFFKTIPVLGHSHPWGAPIKRFFCGRWNTHHGDAVKRAIALFYTMDGLYAHDTTYQTVEFVLAKVKHQLGDANIKTDGDLHRLLTVIKNNTQVDYFTLDAEAVINQTLTQNPITSLKI